MVIQIRLTFSLNILIVSFSKYITPKQHIEIVRFMLRNILSDGKINYTKE
jgi:hypothetical protein